MKTKRSVPRHGFAALCLVAAAAAASGIAAAGEPKPANGVRSVVVRYNDLDLSREQGSQAAYARLRSAARRVCGSVDPRDAAARLAWRTCYQTALDKAVAQLDSAQVTALHATASGGRRQG